MEKKKVTAGRDNLGDFAPKFAELNDDVLFGPPGVFPQPDDFHGDCFGHFAAENCPRHGLHAWLYIGEFHDFDFAGFGPFHFTGERMVSK